MIKLDAQLDYEVSWKEAEQSFCLKLTIVQAKRRPERNKPMAQKVEPSSSVS